MRLRGSVLRGSALLAGAAASAWVLGLHGSARAFAQPAAAGAREAAPVE
eukprot:CAMPEP_0197906576 /NCGR_PEP_ID=MMETSP1439-20131203/62997_1 /TAXON_ID=66791 /ORGANISM="Gonyaulax spinifera, Strain CCMP409" /LENGTH=48 /DNA_ID= /DNA_START= /DNA_END= /DNA_ORIENTATION=